MKCPYRKETVIKIDEDGTKTITVEFLECYRNSCPFWDSYHVKCTKGKN